MGCRLGGGFVGIGSLTYVDARLTCGTRGLAEAFRLVARAGCTSRPLALD